MAPPDPDPTWRSPDGCRPHREAQAAEELPDV